MRNAEFSYFCLTEIKGGPLYDVVLPLVDGQLAEQPRHPEGAVRVHAHVALGVHGGSNHRFALAHNGKRALHKTHHGRAGGVGWRGGVEGGASGSPAGEL